MLRKRCMAIYFWCVFLGIIPHLKTEIFHAENTIDALLKKKHVIEVKISFVPGKLFINEVTYR